MQNAENSKANPVAGMEDGIQPESANDVGYPTLAGPWQRFWARAFDIYLFGLASVFLVALTQPVWLEHEIFSSNSGQAILHLMFLPVALLLEAAVYACFDTTPGKALAGLKLLTAHGDKLTFSQVIRRNLQIYIFGLGLGLPIIILYCLWQRYNELSSWRFPQYDTALGTRVWSNGSDWRTLLVAIPTIAFYLIFSV